MEKWDMGMRLGQTHLHSSRNSLTFHTVMIEVAPAGTTMIGVRVLWSERRYKNTETVLGSWTFSYGMEKLYIVLLQEIYFAINQPSSIQLRRPLPTTAHTCNMPETANSMSFTHSLTTVPPFTFSVWFPCRLCIGGRVPLYHWWLPSNGRCLWTRFRDVFGEWVDGHTVVGARRVNVEFTSLWINHINLSLVMPYTHVHSTMENHMWRLPCRKWILFCFNYESSAWTRTDKIWLIDNLKMFVSTGICHKKVVYVSAKGHRQ